jgi:hypothetical protein
VFSQLAANYPQEVLPNRVYLGDWHHAADPVVIEKLGITHILNISDTCENYLQDSHRKYHPLFAELDACTADLSYL